MKSDAEIRKRLREIKRKYLVQMLDDNLSAHHFNCVHNYAHKDKDGVAHLCLLGADRPENWEGTLCDNDEMSMSCPYFEPKKMRVDIKAEFDQVMSDPIALFQEYRDVAMLMWVLEGDSSPIELDTEPDAHSDDAVVSISSTVYTPWYVRAYQKGTALLNALFRK